MGCFVFATKVKSYAKVNLSLNILGQKDGYHLIDSVAASVDIWDTVCAKPRSDRLINVYMHGLGSENIPPEKNNAVKAGEAFVSAFGTKGADIEIYKDIPIGAGLGGSSADAAGVLNVLAKLYKMKDRAALKTIADTLGSDTGYMLTGGFARMTGRGERVRPVACKRRLYMLLFLPKEGVSAAECYRAYDDSPDPLRQDSENMVKALAAGDFVVSYDSSVLECVSVEKSVAENIVVVNPDTDVEKVFDVFDICDMLLVMSVFPGYGGQKFMPSAMEQLKKARARALSVGRGDMDIEVDGGISAGNAASVAAAGANVLVAGSSIFRSADMAAAISAMRG